MKGKLGHLGKGTWRVKVCPAEADRKVSTVGLGFFGSVCVWGLRRGVVCV